MCARFTLSALVEVVVPEFGLFDMPDLPPRYHIAPT